MSPEVYKPNSLRNYSSFHPLSSSSLPPPPPPRSKLFPLLVVNHFSSAGPRILLLEYGEDDDDDEDNDEGTYEGCFRFEPEISADEDNWGMTEATSGDGGEMTMVAFKSSA